MKRTFLKLFMAGIFMSLLSCQEWDVKVSPPGDWHIPPSYDFSDPSLAKDTKYWLFSSNEKISGVIGNTGITVRESNDLQTFTFNSYVLNDVIEKWAGARLLELDTKLNADDFKSSIRLDHPCVRKVGSEWRMYYSISCGSSPAHIIAWASTTSLESPDWKDKGEVLSSTSESAFVATAPSVCVGGDGKLYMAFGVSDGASKHICGVELNMDSSKPVGNPQAIFKSADWCKAGNADIVYYAPKNTYVLFTTTVWMETYGQAVRVAESTGSFFGDYSDYAGNNRTQGAGLSESSFIVPYKFTGTDNGWANLGSPSVMQDGNRWFMAIHARKRAEAASQAMTGKVLLQIREVTWGTDDNDRTWPAACPEVWGGEQSAVTTADIAGNWQYGTLWWNWYNSGDKFISALTDGFIFNADGTISGSISGTWSFDATTQRLLVISNTWGGEHIYVTLRKARDWEAGDGKYAIVGSGYNATFFLRPGVWMKKSLN